MLKFSNELRDSKLRKIKSKHEIRWSAQSRADQAARIRQTKPWKCSSGPKTDKGKAKSGKNAFKHGFFSQDIKDFKALLRVHKQLIATFRAKQAQKYKEAQLIRAKNKRMSTLDLKAKQMKALLIEAGMKPHLRDIKRLMKEVTGHDEAVFITAPDTPISAEQEKTLDDALARRINGEPLYRILGKREFWGLDFEVTKDTLDPRPDTETLIETVLDFLKGPQAVRAAEADSNKNQISILDLGTGTGCIPISLLTELPNASAVAVDISEAALTVAGRNAEKNDVAGRISFRKSNWFEALQGRKFDIITSNPPYIPESHIENLDVEVKNHDPILALSGGEDGLDDYKKIISSLKNHLNEGGRAFLEIGINQLESVTRLVDESNLRVCDSRADIAGIPRVVEISYGDK